jgi:alkylation response protein AidB-like acyl-CoA dehydrogenase
MSLILAITTKTFEFCAREATQIFGGLAYSRGGQGEKVERLYREVRAYRYFLCIALLTTVSLEVPKKL